MTFLAFAIFAFIKGIKDLRTPEKYRKENLIRRRPVLTIAFAIANMYHFLGTFFNHACCTSIVQFSLKNTHTPFNTGCHIGHVADAGGMYSILFFISVYNAGRITQLPEFYPNLDEAKRVKAMLAVHILGTVLFVPYADVYYGELCKFRETVGVACLAVSAVLTYGYYFYRSEKLARSRLQFQWAVGALMCLAGGVIFHAVDENRIWCWPESYLNGHAIWHVVCAMALFCIYREMRTEREVNRSK